MFIMLFFDFIFIFLVVSLLCSFMFMRLLDGTLIAYRAQIKPPDKMP